MVLEILPLEGLWSNLGQIEEAVGVVRNQGNKNLVLLHCNSSYPAAPNEMNLKVINNLKNVFKIPIGLSDHTFGLFVSHTAIAIGANVIERHFTLDRTLFGPDHSSSLLPNEFKLMVNAVRNVECALGSPVKIGTHSEMCNIKATRKSIVAKCNINKGDLFTTGNITVKRSKEGISANQWDDIIGETSKKSYIKNEIILV